ncbi:unnamed protein product [Phaedon cochleariae]|uniref:Regulation of nuclear pre-mRNA domain-containing protein 2 n=1 Tax=Phaedon cochleariae TaxID=80249 RepID=A0A9N9SF00_PHACE|nr:unnamed protein product [Phaedon cochleariae]
MKPKMGTQNVAEGEFNVPQFEKQLTTLKDSQEAINHCCQWCLQNRIHHKKIVTAWLNVLKRVRVEQRLVLFYLANDVVQYSKRRNYDFVESWGIALQKATTMVRDEKVKHKVLRIFKIWEQRNVYNEEFISDLCGLLSILPNSQKSEEPNEFQPTYVINKIKSCSKLEKDTDVKLKVLKEHNPKIQLDDGLVGSLKDRAHDDVEKELDVYIKHMEDYINALKLEIKNRITLITVLKQAETQLEADRKDVKVVANAYKMFGTRVKTFQRKLEEHKETLSSPVPSPDVNAPSPSPDSDIDLPDEAVTEITSQKEAPPAHYNPKAELQYNAGYYTPTTSTENTISNSFLSNGVSSFIGSETFNLENFNSSIFSNISSLSTGSATGTGADMDPGAAPQPVAAPAPSADYSYSTAAGGVAGVPSLQPPPMPPFAKADEEYRYGQAYSSAPSGVTYGYDTSTSSPYLSTDAPSGANPYPPTEEYNPEDNVQTWEPDASWKDSSQPETTETDTPESPPMFEKEGYTDPVEYHDTLIPSGAVDVDQRILPSISADMDSTSSLGGKDVDHRNLISLTGSPGQSTSNHSPESLWNQTDQDYRIPPSGHAHSVAPPLPAPPVGDQDYRLGFNLEQLKLPPPPPPPPKDAQGAAVGTEMGVDMGVGVVAIATTPRRSDNVDDMDMEMSDDEGRHNKSNENLKVLLDGPAVLQPPPLAAPFSGLEPPPPLPDLPDDEDANTFLDDLVDDLHEFAALDDLPTGGGEQVGADGRWERAPLLPLPPPPAFDGMVGPPMMPMPPMDTSMPPPSMPPPPTPPAMQMMNHPPMMAQSPLLPLPPQPWMPEEDHQQQHHHHQQQQPHLHSGANGGHLGNLANFDDDHCWMGGLGDVGEMDNMGGMDNMVVGMDSTVGMDAGGMDVSGMDMAVMDMPLEGDEGNWDKPFPQQPPNEWMGPPPPNMGFGFRERGRGNNRGNFINNNFSKRVMITGRGRGGNFNRGGGPGNNFRGGHRGGPRGGPRGAGGGNRGFFPRGNFRGNFRGGF